MWPRPRPRLRGPRRPRRARLRARSPDALAAAGVRDEVGKNSDLIVREGVVERGHRALAVRYRFTDDGGVWLRRVDIHAANERPVTTRRPAEASAGIKVRAGLSNQRSRPGSLSTLANPNSSAWT